MPWWIGHRIDPSKNRYRWYALIIQPTLWDTWECWAAWGRIGQPARQHRLLCEGSQGDAFSAAQKRRRQKERRGYQSHYL